MTTEQSMNWAKVRVVQEVMKDEYDYDLDSKEPFELDPQTFSILVEKFNKKMTELMTDEDSTPTRSKLKNFTKILLRRNLSNRDSMILITGLKGSGKSTVAIQLARMWCTVFNDYTEELYKKFPERFGNKPPKKMKYSAKNNIAYSNLDMMKKIDELEQFSPIIGDEAIEFCLAQNWAKAENKILKEKLAKVRTKHLLFILCFPLKINKIERIYLDSFVNYWIDLFDRGKGIIFKKDLNPAVDSWRVKEFKDLGSYDETTPPRVIFKKLKNHPNFFDIITINKLPEKLERQYLLVRERNTYEDKGTEKRIPTSEIKKSGLILSLFDVYSNKYPLYKLVEKIRADYNVSLKTSDVKEIVDYARTLVSTFMQKNVKPSDYAEDSNNNKE